MSHDPDGNRVGDCGGDAGGDGDVDDHDGNEGDYDNGRIIQLKFSKPDQGNQMESVF